MPAQAPRKKKPPPAPLNPAEASRGRRARHRHAPDSSPAPGDVPPGHSSRRSSNKLPPVSDPNIAHASAGPHIGSRPFRIQ
eukprot:scaffold24260_cov126-Isochrysis_galbana.AAC.2